MENYFKNSEQLLHQGDRVLRETALAIINAALDVAIPYQPTRDLVHLKGDRLTVGPLEYDLSRRGDIYVIGTGKATFPIARALEEVLGDRIKQGLVVLKQGQTGSLKRIKIIEASHPIPDENGFRGAREVMALARKAKQGDLVFACITGGSSALLPMPVEAVTLAEKQKVNRLLLSSGASIFEINAVRKHLSQVKGGRLGLAIFPAELINLTVSDVIGDALDYITDPTVPDTSTFADAWRTLEKYDLAEKVPPSVRSYLKAADPRFESPVNYDGMPYHNFVLSTSDTACDAAAKAAESLGLKPLILSTMFDGESRELGRAFASIAKEIQRSGRPLEKPYALIGGGETVVTLNKNFGKGGPNQEFVLGAILNLAGLRDFVVVGLDTDGTDGPTDAAGAVADAFVLEKAREQGVDLHRTLERHEAYAVLQGLQALAFTGQTGTNVNDIKLLIAR